MLDQSTKRKIDNARDILVGKVPDPKSQVEQITIALIYKFMDDMDKEAEEWGGKPTFFTDEYKKYAWSNIFDPRLGGFDLIALYGDAIVKMNQNPNIPQLFRDIFKNAYLPYRDPETLKSFLKEINEFTYDHSEQLGDAFEYLLSVMDSQGDAGQFRTPRHIIDFIVEIVEPKKNETVLDPACGTAGFLISSYKHILKSNTKDRNGDQLTPDERKRLLNNFMGYDISPDMVRLSLVNLYLHGFLDPKIAEYDTLTSEEKWNETADVMLANPPFMTPKGGIRPHKRFSIRAKRSEVLFVDYIAEHLNPHGRAGVIVPEGIIFQSQNAYKNLRKMLVEDYLWAVVSLPSGVFNPYSGVKTSILLMDKSLGKKTDSILFVKIDNDGFDLGAQRRPIDKNDLPQALEVIKDCKKAMTDGGEVKKTDFAHIVEKAKIAESGDWSLSGERYKEKERPVSRQFEEIELGKIVEILDSLRKPIKKADRVPGEYPYYGATGILDYVADYIFDERLVLVGEDGAKWSAGEKTAFIAEGKYWVNNHAHVLRPIRNKVIDTYLVEVLNSMDLTEYITGLTVPKLNQQRLRSIKIPLPPLDIQKAIVAEIDGYQKIIDGALQVVDNYKPTIKIDPDWEMVALGEVCNELKSGFAFGKSDNNSDGFPHLRPMNISTNGELVWEGTKYISKEVFEDKKYYKLKKGDVLFNNTNSKELVGKTCYVNEDIDGRYSNHITRIRVDTKSLNPFFLSVLLHYYWGKGLFLQKCHKWVGQAGVNNKELSMIRIPLPPLFVQQEIVAQIEAEQEIVNATKKLIEMFEQKIKDKISEVWGE